MALMLAEFVQRADARVIDGRGGASFSFEPFQRNRIAGHFIGQELQRHLTPELQVLGAVDDAHAAATQLLYDSVVGNRFVDHS